MTFQPLDALTNAATHHPEGLFYADSEQSLTFAEARDTSTQLASQLRLMGVTAGDTVAIDLPIGMQVLFTYACFHLAAVSASVNRHSLPDGVIWDWWLSTSAPGGQPSDGTLLARCVGIIDNEFFIRASGLSTTLTAVPYESDDSVCRIALTSGTTGRPKAIGLTVSTVEHRANEAEKLFIDDKPFLSALGLSTTSGFHTLIAGTRSGLPYLAPGTATLNRDTIRRHAVSAIKASPQQLIELFAASSPPDLETLRVINSAGGAPTQGLVDSIRAKSAARIVNLYGSSEAGRAAEAVLGDTVDAMFAGAVVPTTTVQVVDGGGGEVPAGVVGEIRYRAPNIATTYLGDEVATATAFRHGWFYPGDRGRLDNGGHLFLSGRVSDTINAGGVKIDPSVVEQFARSLNGVSESLGFTHSPETGVSQFVLAVSGTELNLREIAQKLEAQFGNARPASVFAVPDIPRTETGKLSRYLTAELYADSVNRANR